MNVVVSVSVEGVDKNAGNALRNHIHRCLYGLDFDGPWEISINGNVVAKGVGGVPA
jgi:hypothetical protein